MEYKNRFKLVETIINYKKEEVSILEELKLIKIEVIIVQD